MTVEQLEELLKTVSNKKKSVFVYGPDDNPFNDAISIKTAFEVMNDSANSGIYEGVYLEEMEE